MGARNQDMPDITIIGAGLIGSLLAAVLRKEDYNVHVYERYRDIRNLGEEGRSINLVLTARGLHAAELLDIKDELINIGVPVYGRIMHLKGETDTRFQPYGQNDECNYSVSRLKLNKVLMDKAEKAGARFFFDHPLSDIDMSTDSTILKFNDGKEVVLPPNCPIIGADGGPSAVRRVLKNHGLIEYSEEILEQVYKEITFFPNTSTNEYCMDVRGLHIWPRGKHFLMGLADKVNTFTGTIYVDRDEFPKNLEEAKEFVQAHYEDAIPLCGGLEKMANMVIDNSSGLLGTVRTKKWYSEGRACLIGDAAHAIVPFFGQGCNCGFEDVVAFHRLLKSHPETFEDFEKIFEQFQEDRIENTNAIADMALENFVEMREKVGDITFLQHKKIENKIEAQFPHLFRSRYAMVCYGNSTTATYSAAYKLGKVQYEVVQELLKKYEDPEKLDFEYVKNLLKERVVPVQKELGVDVNSLNH